MYKILDLSNVAESEIVLNDKQTILFKTKLPNNLRPNELLEIEKIVNVFKMMKCNTVSFSVKNDVIIVGYVVNKIKEELPDVKILIGNVAQNLTKSGKYHVIVYDIKKEEVVEDVTGE